MADISIALQGPIQGMSRASADFDRAASNVARAFVSTHKAVNTLDSVELSTSMVNLLQAWSDHAANTKTFRVFDEINRNVLDMIG
jgi:flagellar hook protein FlgE